jgi:hypothetical protein
MQIYITFILLISSGALNGDLEKVWSLAEFVELFYPHFPHGCVFIMYFVSQQRGEDYFYVTYISCALSLNKCANRKWAKTHF